MFFQAGVDIFAGDKLGKLNVSREGLRRRNRMVFKAARDAAVPMVVTMGGGYPRDLDPLSAPFRELVECHADVYREAVGTNIEWFNPK